MKMNFLNYKQLEGILKDIQIKTSEEVLNNKQIEQIKKLIELRPAEELGKGKCLFNAYQVAKITNASIIEGVAYVHVERGDSEGETIIKHAWNILDGNQFDITKDFVWPNLTVNLKKINYFEVNEFSQGEYKFTTNAIDFKSQVDLIGSSLRFLKTKESIESTLNYWGLDKQFHKQLLNDCINSIEEMHKQ